MPKKIILASKKFLKKNSATILTCIGAIGVIGTTITAVKATPKAIALLDEAKKKKGSDLTVFETIKMAGSVYIPSALIGISTIACIFGSNVANKKVQSSMASAYMLIDQSYKEYRKKAKELCGDDIDLKIRDAIMKDKVDCIDAKITPANGLEMLYDQENKVLFYDEYSGRYFESTIPNVQAAEMHLNRNFALGGFCDLNEFYDFLGIDRTDYGDSVGWSMEYGYNYIDFYHRKATLDDGLECYIIEYVFDPDENFENPNCDYWGE